MDFVKSFLESLDDSRIHFKRHFYERAVRRPISEDLVREYLRKTDNLLKVKEQRSRRGERKFRLWIKLSRRYALIVVCVIHKKDLYIVTAWNREGRWQ